MMRRGLRAMVAAAGLLAGTATPVEGQGLAGRVALEGIASLSTQARALDDPMVILDLVSTIRLADGWDIVARPWSMRRPGGDWTFEMYQLQARYVSSTRVPFRVDAGIIPSPVGLFTLELQPHRNPLVGVPFYYVSPLPAVDGRSDRLRLISGGYPLGAMFTVSGMRWDARAGITDSTPAQPHNVLSRPRAPGHAQLVLGGGVTPIAGLRLGAGFTRGDYRAASSSGGTGRERPTASVFNLEGEYAVGHTRMSAEWVRDRFGAETGAAIARGFNLQVTQTLAPRLFVAARATRVSAPVATVPVELRRTSDELEVSAGYRLSTAFTVRGGYQRRRGYLETSRQHTAVMSLVWAERWW